MVTTTIDLTVTPTEEGITIFYRTDNDDLAYVGYFSDYDKRAITKVKAPYVVTETARAYSIIHSGHNFEIYIQPIDESGNLVE